jgi:protein TonB
MAVYGGSVVLHAGLVVGALLLPRSKSHEAVAIELRDAVKKPAPAKPAAPPPPPATAEKEKPRAPLPQRAQAKVSTEPKPEAPPSEPEAKDGFVDLGVALGNGEGVAVPQAGPSVPTATAAASAPAPPVKRKVEQLQAAREEVCKDPIVRPKRTQPVAPKYTLAARQAEIEGVVRVEVTVDEKGNVVGAKVLSGLGYGLDKAALVAARATVFAPASRCGKPVIGTVVLPFRFQET